MTRLLKCCDSPLQQLECCLMRARLSRAGQLIIWKRGAGGRHLLRAALQALTQAKECVRQALGAQAARCRLPHRDGPLEGVLHVCSGLSVAQARLQSLSEYPKPRSCSRHLLLKNKWYSAL